MTGQYLFLCNTFAHVSNVSTRLIIFNTFAHVSVALFRVIFRARFIVSLRPSFLPGPGLGALLSSYLEGALYKFHR